jgi:probable F420-dependent oxidoreductase
MDGELPQEYWHTLDPFGALSAAAAVTSKIKLATGICLLIERDTITTAKEAATVDHLSGGRFLFGVGGGWNVEEMANHGTAFGTRFKKLEEQVAAIREIWRGDPAGYKGEFVSFDPIRCYPKPVQAPGPPIHLGGMSKHTVRRVVDYADGWLPFGFDIDRLERSLAVLERCAEEKGRDPSSVEISAFGAPHRPAALARLQGLALARVVFTLRPAPRDEALLKLDRLASLIRDFEA